MTRAQLWRVEADALKLRDRDVEEGAHQTAQGDFYATLDELTARAKERASHV